MIHLRCFNLTNILLNRNALLNPIPQNLAFFPAKINLVLFLFLFIFLTSKDPLQARYLSSLKDSAQIQVSRATTGRGLAFRSRTVKSETWQQRVMFSFVCLLYNQEKKENAPRIH